MAPVTSAYSGRSNSRNVMKKLFKSNNTGNSGYNGIRNLNSSSIPHPEVICFICDEIVAEKGIPLLMTFTSYSNTDLPTKIGQLMGDKFVVFVAVTDVLCKRCLSLINQLDKLESESLKVREVLTEFLKMKYQLGDTCLEQDLYEEDAMQSSNLEDYYCIDNGGDCSDEQYHETFAEGKNESLDPDYNSVSLGIKKENFKIEDNGSDMKVVKKVQDFSRCGDSVCALKDKELVRLNDIGVHRKDDETVSPITVYECNMCSFNSPLLDSLMDHFESHSDPKPYHHSKYQQKMKCDTQNGTSSVWNDEKCEIGTDHFPNQLKRYKCSRCRFQHPNKKTFDSHICKSFKFSKLICHICSKAFRHRNSLKKHMHTHSVFNCGVCSALFDNEKSLHHHLETVNHGSEVVPSKSEMIFILRNDTEFENDRENIGNGGTKENKKKSIESSERKDPKEGFDLMGNLLKEMHSVEVLKPLIDNHDSYNPSEEEIYVSPCVSEDETDHSKMNVLEQNSSLLTVNTSEISHIKEKLGNPESYSVEFPKNNCSFEIKDKEQKNENLEILGVFKDDCSFDYTEHLDNTKHKSNNDSKEHIMSSHDVEDKCASNNLISKKVYVCSLCGLKTSSETHIKRHFKCHIALERKTFKCHICCRVLTTRSNLKRHINLHEQCASGVVECNMCNEILTDRLHLKHHMEVKHPESYQCSFCDGRFDSKKACREHELTHPALQCDVCFKMFLTEGRLKSHKACVHSVCGDPAEQPTAKMKVFKCHICLKILTTYHNLKRHLRNHEKCSGIVNCILCNVELKDKLHLRQHLEENHPENHQCSFCHKVFGNRKSCKAHEMTHPERFVYKCESCEKLFLTEARLKRHQDVMHRDPHCRICGKEISNPLKLLDHERRHERHKGMFPCEQCPKVFRTPSGLKYHMSVHTGKYAVYCEICGKGMHSEVVLEEHKATHTKEVRYTCDKCGRTFSSNSTYRMHRLWHDNPLPYKCNICDRKFKHTSILAVHKRRAHTGERPYKCPHCSQTFSVSSTLNKHIILHTKEYPYRCTQCEKGFTTRTKIARHMAKVHNDFEMINSKKKACEYKMVLHPSEISNAPKDSEESFSTVDQLLQEKKAETGDETSTVEVLEHVAVDPAQAAIFTIFQQDIANSQFTCRVNASFNKL